MNEESFEVIDGRRSRGDFLRIEPEIDGTCLCLPYR